MVRMATQKEVAEQERLERLLRVMGQKPDKYPCTLSVDGVVVGKCSTPTANAIADIAKIKPSKQLKDFTTGPICIQMKWVPLDPEVLKQVLPKLLGEDEDED